MNATSNNIKTVAGDTFRFRVRWDEVDEAALANHFGTNYGADEDGEYYEYVKGLGEDECPLSRRNWRPLFAKMKLLGEWCLAPKKVREHVNALTSASKLKKLRDAVSSLERLEDCESTFGFDRNDDTFVATRDPSMLVGSSRHEFVIDAELPGPGVFALYRVYFAGDRHDHDIDHVIARSENEALSLAALEKVPVGMLTEMSVEEVLSDKALRA